MMLPQSHMPSELRLNLRKIELTILKLVDLFDIRIVWNQDAIILTGTFAVVGGLMGAYAGGRMGAALGAGIGGAAGYGVSTVVSLREIWSFIKEKLTELYYIVYNYLRRLDPRDCIRAIELLLHCSSSKRELVLTILDFVAHKLDTQVFSTLPLTAA